MLTRRQLLFSLLAPARPNLLLVTFDQLRFDSLGCTGNPIVRTPVIDSLAKRGVLFTRHFVQVPQCVPSRMSIHTGRYPHTHRTLLNGYQIPDDEPTLARLLTAQGYRTASAGDRPFAPRNQLGGFALHLNHQPGQDHGSLLRKNGYSADSIKAQQTKANSGYQDAPVPWPESLDEAKHSTDLALNFLAAPSPQPFFLHVNYRRPHHPFDPPAPYDTLYAKADFPPPRRREGELANKPVAQQRAAKSVAGFDPSQMTPADLHRVKTLYYGMIALCDKQLGRLLDRINLENTVVVFLADHGEMLGDHGLMLKGSYMYDQVLHSPLILAGPGIPRHLKINSLCEAVDLNPTLGQLLNFPTPHAQGQSLVPLFSNPSATHKSAVFAEFPTVKMVRTASHKLVHYPNANYGELYDVSADPDEYDNLYANPAHISVKADLYKLLADWSVRTSDPLRAPVRDAV